ncbi:MAG: 2-phospho-L-lactate guanylyltransferase [Pseudomonadota bacterium]
MAVKNLGAPKSRLSARLSPMERRRLTVTLFKMTLAALETVRRMTGVDIAVITPSPTIREIAQRHQAEVIVEHRAEGLNMAAHRARAWSEAFGYARLCLLPADLAAPDPRDIAALLSAARATGQPVICPAFDGGTNALVLPLPSTMPFCYGPGSATRHMAAARSAGHAPLTLALPSLRDDVDTPAVYARTISHVAIGAAGAAEPLETAGKANVIEAARG